MMGIVLRQKGWSLIEISIAMAVCGLLLSLAWPSYHGFIVKTRRAEAQQQLVQLHLAQQRYRLVNHKYADSESLSFPKSPYYKFSISKETGSPFQLQATAIGTQKRNKGCDAIYLDAEMKKLPQECW